MEKLKLIFLEKRRTETSTCSQAAATQLAAQKKIQYSLGLRIVRICTNPATRDVRLNELKYLVLERKYPEKLIDPALEKARLVPRYKALRKIIRNKQTHSLRPVFATSFDPRLPSLGGIHVKHWRSMTNQDQYLKEVFPQPPLFGFRRQNNLKDALIRANIPKEPSLHQPRQKSGMKKCTRTCPACPFINQTKKVRIGENEYWNINKNVNCNSFNVIYLLECNKERCKQRYIGETG